MFPQLLLSLAMVTAAADTLVVASAPQPGADSHIQRAVEHRLSNKDIRTLTVTVRDGVVIMVGPLPNLWTRDEAIKVAADVAGVQRVVADIAIPRTESDETIAAQAAARIRQYAFYTIFDDVVIDVRNGVITLDGRVTMPYKINAMEALLTRVDGAQEVCNQFQALPASPFDNHLRFAIAKAIYRDSLFWHYAIQVHPPIHIIVENSRVTLTGVVRSKVEQREAEAIARSAFGVLSVDNRLRVALEP